MKIFYTGMFAILISSQSLFSKDDPQISPYAGAFGWEETKGERTQWFKDAKFGMFIHWGLYTSAAVFWPPENGKKYPQHYAEWIRNWAKVDEPEYGQLTKKLFKPALVVLMIGPN